MNNKINQSKIYLCAKCEFSELCKKREEREPILNQAVEKINEMLSVFDGMDWLKAGITISQIKCEHFKFDKAKKDLNCGTCKHGMRQYYEHGSRIVTTEICDATQALNYCKNYEFGKPISCDGCKHLTVRNAYKNGTDKEHDINVCKFARFEYKMGDHYICSMDSFSRCDKYETE